MSTDPSTEVTEPGSNPATNPADEGTGAGGSTTGTGAENNANPAAEEPPKPLTGDEKKEQILSSFQERMDSGDIDIDYIKKVQPWAAEELEKRQQKEQSPDLREVAAKTAEETARKVAQEEREKAQLERFDEKILDADPSQEQLKIYFDEKKKYAEALGPIKAAELAAKLAGISVQMEDLRRRSMSIPEPGSTGSGEQPKTPDQIIQNQANMSDEEIATAIRKQRGL